MTIQAHVGMSGTFVELAHLMDPEMGEGAKPAPPLRELPSMRRIDSEDEGIQANAEEIIEELALFRRNLTAGTMSVGVGTSAPSLRAGSNDSIGSSNLGGSGEIQRLSVGREMLDQESTVVDETKI